MITTSSSKNTQTILQTILGIIAIGIGVGLLNSWYLRLFGYDTTEIFVLGFIAGAILAGGFALILRSTMRRP